MRPALRDWIVRCVAGLLLGHSLACSRGEPPPGHALFRIDHLILGAPDLERGIAGFRERTGLEAAFGGEHPSVGTHNALASLGDQTYLEIIAPRAGVEVRGRWRVLTDLEGVSPVGWAVRTTDMERAVTELRRAGFQANDPVPGSRVQPDGPTLHWKTAAIAEPDLPLAPFLIEWGAESVHPSKTTPQGCRLSAVEIRSANPEPLARLMDLFGLDVRVESSREERLRIELECLGRSVSF